MNMAMNRDWESVFERWSKGPSDTELSKAENAERQIREAIQASDRLKARDIRVFTQGSYRNRVNVRQSSDVDIGVVCFDAYFSEYKDENVKAQLVKSFVPATYQYATFKQELEEALVARFGRSSVTRGSKAFDIKANSYRVDADVVPFFEHRRYTSATNYLSGVEMIPDNFTPPRIRNWPEQHYENGVNKNNQTSRKFKRTVRILKSLADEMSLKGYTSAKVIQSFLIECLVFNAHNDCFNYSSFKEMIRAVLGTLCNYTMNDSTCNEWGEVNELKYLFRPSQPWTRQEANQFLNDAWNYIGYR
jgi:hypothetical protein